MTNIKKLNKEKVFSKERELSERIGNLITEYDGELSLVSVVGILDLKKLEIINNND